MECTLCQSPLAEGAKVCGACGAPALFDAAATIAGGRGPDTSGGPPRGEVLAERWEIQERIATDALMSRYRALDQETEAQVVLTIIAPDLVPTVGERDAIRDRLGAAVGVGGKYLPGLLDADREAQFVFAVEPLVLGSSLRSVLDARRARHETMQVTELLPVVAQLAAGLAGVAPPHHHGDVRAERVVIAKEGLRLVGGFIVPALPAAAIARALSNDEGWRAVVAPEVLRGAASDSADCFGVAAIAFEALTGRLPSFVGPRLPRELEPVDDALRALLSRDPTTRPGSLDALIEALAECAHLPIPDLDPGAFRRVRRPAPSRPAPPIAPHAPPSATSEVETSPDSATPPNDPEDLGAETSPLTKIDADSTSRMPALNADGEPEVPPLASSGSYPDIPDLATDPMSTMPTSRESSRAAQILVPDSLPPAYRVDEGRTLSESALRTRRVLAQPATAPSTSAPEAPVAVAASAGKPASVKQAPSGRARPVAGAATGGTQEIEMDEVFDGTPVRAKRQDDSLDPRLVRAALGVALDDVAPALPAGAKKKPRDDDSLDPRLVRAALGIALDGADDDEENEPATTMRAAAAPTPRKSVTGDTQQLTADDLADMSAAAGRRSARVTSDNGPPSARRKREEEPPRVVRIPRYDVAKHTAAPQPSSRVPPPAAPNLVGTVPLPPTALRAQNDPITQDAPPAPVAPAPVAVAPLASVPTAVSALPGRPAPLRGPVASAEDLMTPAPHASRDRAVIWVSLVLALVIVGVGAGIAWWRHTQAVNDRERRLQERFQELRNQP